MKPIVITLPGEKPVEIKGTLHLDIMIAKLERISYDEKLKLYRGHKDVDSQPEKTA